MPAIKKTDSAADANSDQYNFSRASRNRVIAHSDSSRDFCVSCWVELGQRSKGGRGRMESGVAIGL